MPRGSLTVVGTGILVAGHTTLEALAQLRCAEKLFYLVADPATQRWLRGLNATAESLYDAYAPGRHRAASYAEMVERILAPVRSGLEVCAAFYGHPGVAAFPGHEAVRRARHEGYAARMLPGVSAEDCLFADLGVDPGRHGCQSFDASRLVLRRHRIDVSSSLVIWQIGAVGVVTHSQRRLWSRRGLRLLTEVLLRFYPPSHQVVRYEAAPYPVCRPVIERLPLSRLPRARVTMASTLYVPPLREAGPRLGSTNAAGRAPGAGRGPRPGTPRARGGGATAARPRSRRSRASAGRSRAAASAAPRPRRR